MHYMGMASLLIPAEIVWMPGCNEVQGYLIGPPQPIAHYHGFVAKVAGIGAKLMAIAS
jgi:hypothetical protein